MQTTSGAIALALLGAVIWRAEPESLRIRPYVGKMGNVLSATINGKAFAFPYEHDTQEIEMREGTIAGPIYKTFSNATQSRMWSKSSAHCDKPCPIRGRIL